MQKNLSVTHRVKAYFQSYSRNCHNVGLPAILSNIQIFFILQVVVDKIDGNQTTLATLQKSAQAVLIKLPTSEAKLAIKKELLAIQNKYEELQWKVCNQLKYFLVSGSASFTSPCQCRQIEFLMAIFLSTEPFSTCIYYIIVSCSKPLKILSTSNSDFQNFCYLNTVTIVYYYIICNFSGARSSESSGIGTQ